MGYIFHHVFIKGLYKNMLKTLKIGFLVSWNHPCLVKKKLKLKNSPDFFLFPGFRFFRYHILCYIIQNTPNSSGRIKAFLWPLAVKNLGKWKVILNIFISFVCLALEPLPEIKKNLHLFYLRMLVSSYSLI